MTKIFKIAVFSALLMWVAPVKAGLAPANFGAMYNFAAQGKTHVLKNAVDRGMDIDSVNHNGFTGLCVAIYRKDYVAFRVFKSLGANTKHECVKKISKERYDAFWNGASQQGRVAHGYSYQNQQMSGSYRNDYGNYQADSVSRGRFGHINYQADEESFISSDTVWTIGGVGLIAGGIAIAFSSSGGGDDEDPEKDIIDNLNGVAGVPYLVQDNLTKNVVETSSGDLSNYWGVYNPDNKNIINRDVVDVYNMTPNVGDSQDHWGAIFAKNGYVYNTGNINISGENMKYGKGIMSCVVSVYNPDNASCIVDAANPIVGDIYNAGNITVTADQSMGIFSSTINKITNTGNITMTGNDNAGIWLWGKGDVSNSGKIILTGSKTDAYGGAMTAIWIYESGNAVNNGEIKVTDSGLGGTGLYTKNGTVTNNSTITIIGKGSTSGSVGLNAFEGEAINNGKIIVTGGSGMSSGNSAKLINNSEIIVTDGLSGISTDSGDALNAKGASISVTGSGSGIISGGKVTNEGKISAANDGIHVIGDKAQVHNTSTGIINANKEGIRYDKDEEATGEVKIVNDGHISSGGMAMSGDVLENNGTIDAVKSGGTSKAIHTFSCMINKGTLNSSGSGIGADNFYEVSSNGKITNSGNIFINGAYIENSELNKYNSGSFTGNILTVINEGNVVSTQNGVLGYMKSVELDKDTVYIPAKVTFTNSGSMTINGAKYGVYTKEGEIKASSKSESSLTFTNSSSGKIEINENGLGEAYGVYATDVGNMTNDGEIIINSESENVEIVGMHADNGTLTNNGLLKIDAPNSSSAAGKIIGMQLRKGEAINNGEIRIYANNAYGMYVNYYKADWEGEVPKEPKILAKAINNGLIRIDGENNIGIVADGARSGITNKGTIEVKKPNVTDVYIAEGDEANIFYDGSTCSSFICLKNSASYENSGITSSAYAMNFDNFGDGNVILSKGGSFEAPSISGNVIASTDIVTGSNEDSYKTEKAFVGEDAGIDVSSASYLFTASLQDKDDGSKDLIMKRKSFTEVEDNASVAEFLESNYKKQNNTELYDLLKVTGSAVSLSSLTDENLGLGFFPNFAKQNLDVLKSMNRSINNTVLSNSDIKDERATVGYDNFYRKQDGTDKVAGYSDSVNSIYGIFDKKYDNNLRYGWGMSYSKYHSKYNRGNERDENIIQLFAPIIYQNDNMQFISTPRIGYGWGDYSRFVNGSVFEADTDSYYYGLANELRHEIDLGILVFEPIFELNMLGLYQNEMKEDKQLEIADNNNLSVEAGLGLYVKKTVKFGEDELKLRVGGTYYHEFAEPYRTMTAEMFGMDGKYNLNSYKVQRNRGVLSARAEYQHDQATVYGEFEKFIEDDGGYEINAGLNWKF